MTSWVKISAFAIIAVAFASCGGSEPAEAPPQITGPALVMFYTDN